ncbi:ZP domain-containing protein-like [Stylophora pistillata]|uniref:CUB and zona pellucida-like domain-containing protein 1 n=1 Tax=Stylophora pistillata TaxID=50429 RepID=A0A2B4SE74_STYPI|nr:ZP domain-containing protein-like [Stylophora pistillata]PFX28974.1 CUB and zona pellucida-like domain-containing protein 1 [Stylophora pistillata]
MNPLLLRKLLLVGVVWVYSISEADGSVCSPSNTDIDIDAQVPGVISTPEFPDGSTGSSCAYKIQAPENFRLAITIEALKFAGLDDHLVIHDGADDQSPMMGRYGSCTTGSLTLFSRGNAILLKTVSATFRTSNELRIAYRAIESETVTCSSPGGNLPNLCTDDNHLGGLSGVISSPNFPKNYGAKEYCTWNIAAPPGYRIQFAIRFLGIENYRYSKRPNDCFDDSITISESRENKTRDIKKLCGCQSLFSFITSEETMFVTFRTYRENNWPGFYATYQALSPEECPSGNTNCPLKDFDPTGFNAQGEVCKSSAIDDSRPTDGGNITLYAEAKIDVVCRPDFIEVSLKISDFPGIVFNDSSLHLEDRNCVPGYKDDLKVTFKFGLEDCDTRHVNDREKIYYKNKIYLKAGEAAEDEAITREHTEIIPFHCGYNKKAILSKVSYNPRVVQILTDTEGVGNFTYYMDMYEDENNNVTVTQFPKEVGLGQKMYYGFRVESEDTDLVVFPDVCKATASPNFDSTPDHVIIDKACSKDNTLQYNYGQSSEHFFNIAAFRFAESFNDIYVHCKLTICRKDDGESRCAKGCQPTRRRTRSTEEDFDASLYIGPLKPKVVENKAVKENQYNQSDSDNSMISIVGILVGVLGTVAIGLIISLIVISRRRKSSGQGLSLIVSEEM